MEKTLDSILESLPDVIEGFRNRHGDPKRILEARGKLLGFADGIVNGCAKEGRAMKPDELRRVDSCMAHLGEVNAALAEYKRFRESVNDSGLPVILPF